MPNGAERLLETLDAHGVEYVFGVCGDTSVGFYRAFERTDADIEHVLARDERSASYMADAYARFSGKPGVTEGPSGGGATYLLPGLAEADDSCVPVVGLNTTVPVAYRNRGVLTELDQASLLDGVTKWNASVDHPEAIPRMVRRAFQEATSGRPGATHLSLPMDVLDGVCDSDAYANPDAIRYPAYRSLPDDDRIDRAAEVIEGSERPLIVAGGGVHSSRAWEELRAFAEQVGVPVAQTLSSVGCVGDSPYSIGVVGENGSRAYANEMLAEADTLLLFGTAVESVWTEKWSRPADGEKRIVHADVHAESIGKNYRTEVALPGDLRAILDRLLDAVGPDEKWDADAIAARHAEWVAPYEERFDADEFPLRPERLVAGANEVFNDDAIIVSDPGTTVPYFASLYEFVPPGRHWVTPRAHGALGYGIPGVVGAHYARPESQVIGLTGDGGAGMSLGELETLGRLDVPVTIIVVNNGSFSWIEAGQRNYDDFSFAVDFDGVDYAGVAEEMGVSGHRVRNADEYEEILAEAVEHDGPSLVDLPTKPLPETEDVPVDWLEPDE